MSASDPLHIESRSWAEYVAPDFKELFEHFAEPISSDHLAQVRVIPPEGTRRLRSCARAANLYARHLWEQCFRRVETIRLTDCYNEDGVAEVRQWLFERGIPFQRRVFALGDRDCSLETTWKMVVRYWEAFEQCPGGLGTLVFDHTLQWAVWFDHEEVIVFGSNLDPGG